MILRPAYPRDLLRSSYQREIVRPTKGTPLPYGVIVAVAAPVVRADATIVTADTTIYTADYAL